MRGVYTWSNTSVKRKVGLSVGGGLIGREKWCFNAKLFLYYFS